MLSSRLPTGTISRDSGSRRTYPQETNDRPPSGGATRRRPEATEIPENRAETLREQNEALREQNEALREQNARLRTQLHSARERRQDVVDRYEHVVTDVENKVEPARTRRQHTPRGRIASLVARVGSVLFR